jgi:hypothetical protein
MIHIFVKRGFEYQYTFKKNYDFYKKNAWHLPGLMLYYNHKEKRR